MRGGEFLRDVGRFTPEQCPLFPHNNLILAESAGRKRFKSHIHVALRILYCICQWSRLRLCFLWLLVASATHAAAVVDCVQSALPVDAIYVVTLSLEQNLT
jgi:hypothetical protein